MKEHAPLIVKNVNVCERDESAKRMQWAKTKLRKSLARKNTAYISIVLESKAVGRRCTESCLLSISAFLLFDSSSKDSWLLCYHCNHIIINIVIILTLQSHDLPQTHSSFIGREVAVHLTSHDLYSPCSHPRYETESEIAFAKAGPTYKTLFNSRMQGWNAKRCHIANRTGNERTIRQLFLATAQVISVSGMTLASKSVPCIYG